MSTNPDQDRDDLLKIFAATFGNPDGEKMLDALVKHAQQIQVSADRVGFSDCILFILRNRARGKELTKPPSVRGKARLAEGVQVTEE